MKMNKQEHKKRAERKLRLKGIFEATHEYCITSKKTNVTTEFVDDDEFSYIMNFYDREPKTVKIDVQNIDCITLAGMQKGRTCMLNMANANTPGGGVRNGAMAQEEELCRRSNLIFGLKPQFYPITDDFIYSKNVKFFKDSQYNLIDEFKCDVITIAAPNLIPFKNNKKPKGYTKNIDDKIKKMLEYPATKGVKHLVLSAFGCGAFRNNPTFISRRFKKLIKNLPYDTVTFAILDDHNSIANGKSNLNTFKKTFKVS